MKNVLVIDDDRNTTSLLCRLLNKHGFTTIASNSGREGIWLVQEYNPEIVILDLMMPDMTGWQVCEEIRGFSDVHILIMSAVSEPKFVSRALCAGANYFLAKPTPITTLVAYLTKVCSRPAKQTAPAPVLYPLY